MSKLKICAVLLYAFLTVKAQGPDPWDSENGLKISNIDNKNEGSLLTVNPQSDIFYKRILQLIINRGRFKPTSKELLTGYLHFEFSTEDFNLLRSYSSLTHPLSAKEFRRIDGLLADGLIFPSIVQIYAENFIDFSINLLKKYYVQLIFTVAFIILFNSLRHTNLKQLFSFRSFVILFLFVSLLWEVKLQIEKSNVIEYKKISWWKFWEKDNEIVLDDIKSIYEILHPIDIVGNVVSKIFFKPIHALMNVLDKYSELISGKFMMPFNSLVYMFMTITYFIILIIVCCSLFFYVVFGVAIDLSFLGFRASFKSLKQESTENRNTQNITNAIEYKKKPPYIIWARKKNQSNKNNQNGKGQSSDKSKDKTSKTKTK